MNSYHQNFSLDQASEIKTFFTDNGYVVIKDILTIDECQLTYNDIGNQMKSINSKFDISNINTYGDAPINNNYGMYTGTPIFSEQFLLNRQNKNVYKAFSMLCDEKELIVSHDRCCFYRPTKNILINGETVDKPEWKTGYTFPGLHLDFHPSSFYTKDS